MLLSHVAPNLQRLLLLMSLIMAAKSSSLGIGGTGLHEWVFQLTVFRQLLGLAGGEESRL